MWSMSLSLPHPNLRKMSGAQHNGILMEAVLRLLMRHDRYVYPATPVYYPAVVSHLVSGMGKGRTLFFPHFIGFFFSFYVVFRVSENYADMCVRTSNSNLV